MEKRVIKIATGEPRMVPMHIYNDDRLLADYGFMRQDAPSDEDDEVVTNDERPKRHGGKPKQDATSDEAVIEQL